MSPSKYELTVGKKYFTRSNDLVEVCYKEHVNTPEGPTHHFDARVLRIIQGHEGLMGRPMKFTAEGKWINPETGSTVEKCIHDLKEEACADAE